MSVDFFGDGVKRYGWAHPLKKYGCIYLNLRAEEVGVHYVQSFDTETVNSKSLGLVCIGQVVVCVADIYGVRIKLPGSVQKWIDETRLQQVTLEQTITIKGQSSPTKDIVFPTDIKWVKAITSPKIFCSLQYNGVGDCTCGKCSIKKQTLAGSKNIFQYPKEML